MITSNPKEKRMITISLRITQSLDEILEDTARKMRVSKSQIIRDRLANFNSPKTEKAA
jgi:predicted transcriptional regulator